MSLDTHDDDLATRFAATRRLDMPAGTDAELAAVHAASRRVQRRRVLGGSAAAGLLVIGGGAIALTGGTSTTTTAVPAAEGAPLVEREAIEPTAIDDPAVAPDAVIVPGDSASPTAELPDLTDLPMPDLPPLPEPGADGTTDWDAYAGELAASFETWIEDLSTWIDANPEVTTFLDLVGPFDIEGGSLDGVDLDEWLGRLGDLGQLLPDGTTDLENLEAMLAELGIDVDEWKLMIEEWSAQYDQGDLGDWSARADQWRAELGELDLDLDQWLAELDLSQLDALGEFELPELDLSQLDALDDLDLSELLEGFEEFDLSETDLDLSQLDIDFSELGLEEFLADLDLGGLFGSD